MPEYNMTGGALASHDGNPYRNRIEVYLNPENFSGQDGYQKLSRDYCDECLPEIWKEITAVLAYRPLRTGTLLRREERE
jgi:hypothetical protein